MMEHNCTGRCALIIERAVSGCLRSLALAAALLLFNAAHAAPVDYQDERLAAALATAEGAWADSLLKLEGGRGERDTLAYDEQIFTELSPILDSPEAIKLPEDQLLTD